MIRTARALPLTNLLLDRLRANDRAQLIASGEAVELVSGEVLVRAGEAIRHVYFPIGAFISLLVPMGGKAVLEVAIAGSEGMCGVPVALGVAHSPVNAVVQGAGSALRIRAGRFKRQLARLPRLRASMDRYIHVHIVQLTHAAGCNRFHFVEQRVARWLLETSDRAGSPTFPMTHELLAHMLGVRRVGVTEAAGALQARRLIGYRRGIVTIVDRRGMERASCSCYEADRVIQERFFG